MYVYNSCFLCLALLCLSLAVCLFVCLFVSSCKLFCVDHWEQQRPRVKFLISTKADLDCGVRTDDQPDTYTDSAPAQRGHRRSPAGRWAGSRRWRARGSRASGRRTAGPKLSERNLQVQRASRTVNTKLDGFISKHLQAGSSGSYFRIISENQTGSVSAEKRRDVSNHEATATFPSLGFLSSLHRAE